MITAEVAVYPLKTSDATNVINNSINTLQNTNVNYTVDSMNTKITGTKEQIFDSLNKMFTEAENSGGEVNMVVTLSNSTK
ncbi:YkoF family thiamine/hydroxymethylpyrimidine-binding protein [Clostridium ganghwense]|uniref:YkoF family thiamine/hydroxymethylpyrimidine-binding protein n=1 Tax=Clostridium ganghwense TaxID=312089 RepID=A0ABT4CKB8_9CLOT|nr:YkoF family thiamine/hydroxymethylpyrimidine-binding protein [Clostridium ganghwense]MCY6369500.1 YkoF family thiamine/hydroxymethylpyrimidine-binding protein [Clostridium ganghwense]